MLLTILSARRPCSAMFSRLPVSISIVSSISARFSPSSALIAAAFDDGLRLAAYNRSFQELLVSKVTRNVVGSHSTIGHCRSRSPPAPRSSPKARSLFRRTAGPLGPHWRSCQAADRLCTAVCRARFERLQAQPRFALSGNRSPPNRQCGRDSERSDHARRAGCTHPRYGIRPGIYTDRGGYARAIQERDRRTAIAL